MNTISFRFSASFCRLLAYLFMQLYVEFGVIEITNLFPTPRLRLANGAGGLIRLHLDPNLKVGFGGVCPVYRISEESFMD